MAEALASFLADQLAPGLIPKLEEHVMLAVDAKKEIKKLEDTFRTIQDVLNDAEQRQFQDKSIKRWLNQFKDVAYDMDDVLDKWRTETLRLQIEGTSVLDEKKVLPSCSSCLIPSLSRFTKVALRYDMGAKIKDIRKRLDWICNEQKKFKFTISNQAVSELVYDIPDYRKTSRIVDADYGILGRVVDKRIILNRLVGESSTSTGTSSSSNESKLENEACDRRIISIIGMGGIGKTTLAQGIINDPQVQGHFQLTMWVCVSEPFDLTRIVKAIIHEAGETLPASFEWNALHVKLCESIKGKLFLLVLDDVWTEDDDHWKPLKNLLNYGAIGSRILVTTRSDKVVKMMNAYQYPLDMLSSKDCWSLLSRKAFEGRKSEEIEDLIDIGIEIAKKCKGLPLAASILGSLLRKKSTRRDWLRVLESRIWELEEGQEVEEKLFKPLMLSYNDLKSPLKRCFAYCVIFPKDYQMKKQTLIRMWMAQGFLNLTTRQDLDLEAIGEKYFNDLADYSFFQDFSQDDDDDDGTTVQCKMHDIVHDFIQFLTKDEFYVKHVTNMPLLDGCSKARHLTLTYSDDDEVDQSSFYASLFEAKNLRSLISDSAHFSNKNAISAEFFHHLRCLRVLRLDWWGITHLSSEIKELIHLRYLDLSDNVSLNELPNSVCSLYNLQTLKLTGCKELFKLPKGIGKLINLRHLDIRGTAIELSFPEGTGKLISTSLLVVTGSSKGCNTRELKDLGLLQGCIDIREFGRLRTAKEASKVKLLKKKQALFGNTDDGIGTSQNEGVQENLDAVLVVEITEGFFGVLQPHPNLRELTISNYPGLKLGSWITSLTRLCILKISNIQNCTRLPALGLLPSLEELIVVNLHNLAQIGVEIYGNGGGEMVFPKLQKLFICTDNLEEWDIGDGVEEARKIMPNVRCITLKSKKLKVLPAFCKLSSLETLILKGSTEMTHIGPEFYGIVNTAAGGGGGSNGSVKLIAFPKLKSLRVEYMKGLEEFDLGVDLKARGGNPKGEIIIMPHLSDMIIYGCSKLKTLRALNNLNSLEVLNLHDLEDLEAVEVVAERGEDSIIMPRLRSLEISLCPKLKSLQQHHLPKLIYVRIMYCCSLLQLPTSPNLISLEIFSSALPQGLAGFEKLRHLCFYKCSFLTCIPEDVRHLTALQKLEIQKCDWPPRVDPDNIIDQDKEAWSIMSHIPIIIIKGSMYKLISQRTQTGREYSYTTRI